MNIEAGKIYYVSYYYRIEYHKFFYVTEVSSSGKTFKCREVKPVKTYSDAPYNTMGMMCPSNEYESTEIYTGRYSKKGNPYVRINDEKKVLHEYENIELSFDFND